MVRILHRSKTLQIGAMASSKNPPAPQKPKVRLRNKARALGIHLDSQDAADVPSTKDDRLPAIAGPNEPTTIVLATSNTLKKKPKFDREALTSPFCDQHL